MKAALIVLAAAALLAGCTGVPSSSAPQTLERIGVGPADSDVSGPVPGLSARGIVQGFLGANASDTSKHTTASEYLTAAARNAWSDEKATIIADERVGTYSPRSHTVVVYGQQVGTLDDRGVYTPTLQSNGADELKLTFRLTQVKGEYRISAVPPPGELILTTDQFAASYRQQILYFYDLAGKYLVPDLRYSAISDRTALADWMLQQLVLGPRNELQRAVTQDTLPAGLDASRVSAVLGSPTNVQIPEASQLAPAVLRQLAAQVSQTLAPTLSSGLITIMDGARQVSIPNYGSTFAAVDFGDSTGPPSPEPAVYYLSNTGRVYLESGKPLPGPLGDGTYDLTSVALARPLTDADSLAVAGVEPDHKQQRLVVGTQTEGLAPTSVRGTELSRPAFAPGGAEVWIGDGSDLYRVTVSGTASHASSVSLPAGCGRGRIVAVRLSPDGSRIALVLATAGPDQSGQLCIGSVVRGSGAVRIDTNFPLQSISPPGVVVTDVAWADSLRLLAIGHPVDVTFDAEEYETAVDGSNWTARSINLVQAPSSLTVARAQAPWISTGGRNGFVWVESGSDWVSPGGVNGQQAGSNPVYLGA